mmetsp:Transcript_6124/g.13609  ORF Transcript_6124/g.13609 Transcript_6124/m.13609 type:complete len:219 (-) Transcript_6124:836-1492(-)
MSHEAGRATTTLWTCLTAGTTPQVVTFSQCKPQRNQDTPQRSSAKALPKNGRTCGRWLPDGLQISVFLRGSHQRASRRCWTPWPTGATKSRRTSLPTCLHTLTALQTMRQRTTGVPLLPLRRSSRVSRMEAGVEEAEVLMARMAVVSSRGILPDGRAEFAVTDVLLLFLACPLWMWTLPHSRPRPPRNGAVDRRNLHRLMTFWTSLRFQWFPRRSSTA